MSNTIFMIHGMWGGAWYWQNYVSFFTELKTPENLKNHIADEFVFYPFELSLFL